MSESAQNKDMTIGEPVAATASPTPESDLDPLLQRPLRELSPSQSDRVNGVAIGRIVAVDPHGVLLTLPGLHETPVPAQLLCALPNDWAERPCAVLFENGDPARPMVMGLLLQDTEYPQPVTTQDHELHVDRERVVIQADSELELRCGESVILLLRDGRIEIRGNYITSQATATQRLRGGSIHMN